MKSSFFVFGFILLVGLFIGTIVYHESVHVMANDKVGFDSEFKVMLWKGVVPAVAIQSSGEFEKDLTNYEMIQLQNEVVNYNVIPVLFGIMMVLIMGFSEVLKRMDVKK